MKLSPRERLEQLIAEKRAKLKLAIVAEQSEAPSFNFLNQKEKELDENAVSRFSTDGNFEAIIKLPETQEQPEMAPKESESLPPVAVRETTKTGTAREILLNEDQQKALEMALSGKSFCLIGPAGTGKTTCMKYILQALRDAGLVSILSQNTKYLYRGLPAILVTSYTNKAVANIARGMPKDIQCRTMHKTIEFEPEFFEVLNAEGDMVKTMRFLPQRNRFNRLPHLSHIIVEEGSTISTHLHAQFLEALSGKAQFIYMGDIQQLPPVFGDAILGYKMLELPVVELKTVMRQALESLVLAFAWRILKGTPITLKEIEGTFNKEGELTIRPWKKRLTAHNALKVCSLLFCGGTNSKTGDYIPGFLDSGEYDPMEDMILMPYAKRNSSKSENWMCTDELNKAIAGKLGKMRNAVVHEVIGGYNKYYLAIGDKVLVNKQEALIEKISPNGQYVGKTPIDPSVSMNRDGHYEKEDGKELILKSEEMHAEDLENLLIATSALDDVDERKNQASHLIDCKMLDSDEVVTISTTGELAELSFAYALTVHKAQGSEWKRVILLLHNSHDKMISRELLYTAVTRARESLYIICEPNHFEKGVLTQRIKGDTLEEKAEWFKGRKDGNRKSLFPEEE